MSSADNGLRGIGTALGMLLLLPPGTAGAVDIPVFDRFFGAFNPPEYIPIDVTSDAEGNVYVLDIYHFRVRKFDQQVQLLEEWDFDAQWTRGIAVDSQGNIYICDTAGSTFGNIDGAVIIKFDENFNFIKQWEAGARGISIDGQDRILAASTITDDVRIYDTEGNLLQIVGDGDLNDPTDAVVGNNGHIYVADTLNARMAQFDPAGNLVRTWGTAGPEPENFASHVAVEVDSAGNLFVTDRRNFAIKKFSPEGEFIALVGEKGYGPGRFQEAHGIDVDPFDNVWLANYHGHDIQSFDSDLEYRLSITGVDSGPAEFADVRGVGVDSEHNFYVADKWNQRITKFDRDGNFLFAWGTRGQGLGPEFNFPRAIHVDAEDNVYVSDDGHVRKFDRFGNFLDRWGKYQYSRGITTDAYDHVYIAEPLRHRIVKIHQPTGAVTILGSRGPAPGEFDVPWGVAVGPNDRLYVTDHKNSRVQRLTLDGQYEMEWGVAQAGNGELIRPTGIDITDDGLVYVADARREAVYVFDLDGVYQGEWGSAGSGPGQFAKIYSLAVEPGASVIVGDVDNINVQRFVFDVPIDPLVQPPFQAGRDLGYFLGVDATGLWSLNWSGEGERRDFTGSVVCDQPISNVQPVRFEGSDELSVRSDTLRFEGHAGRGDDGVRFRTPVLGSCTFDLYIDRQHRSLQVRIGNQAAQPVALPVTLTAPALEIRPGKPLPIKPGRGSAGAGRR